MNTALLPPTFPATWASEWGQDSFGLFMDLECQGVRQRFRWIMPGTFLMGSPKSELERWEDETQHEVTLTRGYWLADSACTQAFWAAIMNENPSHFKDDSNNPVEGVSWKDVQQFIEQLNNRYGDLHARLPTEAEWEYACRAGTITPFSLGENITPEQVNYNGNYPYADGEKGLYREKTVAVRSLVPNAWGLYEMHGNVWEWCADGMRKYEVQAVIDPVGSEDDDIARMVRGGSWFYDGRGMRSASRTGSDSAGRGDVGFRLALGHAGSSEKATQ